MFSQGNPDPLCLINEKQVSKIFHFSKMTEELNHRTRVYLTNQDHCESVSRVHGRYFEGLNPANTTIEVSNLIGDHLVEIEAEAIVDEG